jgi:hypothetical protein
LPKTVIAIGLAGLLLAAASATAQAAPFMPLSKSMIVEGLNGDITQAGPLGTPALPVVLARPVGSRSLFVIVSVK